MSENIRVANNKLSRAIVEKLLAPTVVVPREIKREDGLYDVVYVNEPNLNSKHAIQLLIELSKKQNSIGQVESVHYKDFCKLLGCCKQTFYAALEQLQEKGYITRNQSKNDGYWSVFIRNNVFTNKKDDKKGYLNTNLAIFDSKGFKSLSCVAKRICLYILLNRTDRFGEFVVYPETLAKRIGLKVVSVVLDALEDIKEFFPSKFTPGKQGGMIVFLPSSRTPRNDQPEHYNYFIHKLKVFCSMHKISFTSATLHDVSKLFCTFRKKLDPTQIIYNISNLILQYKSLQPALINSFLTSQSRKLE